MAHTAVVTCPNCDTANRVNLETSLKKNAKCGRCSESLNIKHGVINTSTQGLKSLIATADRPVIVDFWAPWCGPCVNFAPVYERVAGDSLNRYIFAKIDTQENPEISSELGIRGIPTVMKFSGGKEIARQAGAMPEPMFRQWLG